MLNLEKITNKTRVELMSRGFHRIGFMSAKEFTERLFDPEYLPEYMNRIRYIFSDMLESGHEPLNIASVRSRHMEDTDGCRYDFYGKSYLIDDILFHVYPRTETVSVIKIR